MKAKLLLLLFLLTSAITYSQDRVTVHPKNSYVKENLDLNAVSLIYEESTNLEDFSQRLNYPSNRISNLDLNNDDKVDYLRVSEKTVNNIKIILIQSEVDSNIYEDVASINIVLKSDDSTSNPKAIYTTDSGIKPKDILIPFIVTTLNIILSRHH